MDIKDGVFEEFNQNTPPMYEDKPVKLPLPDEDFDENGRVKPLRKRMLKKLFRQEIKYYLPMMSLMLGCVLGVGLVFSILLRITINTPEVWDSNYFLWIFIPSIVLYLYGVIGGSLFSVIYPVTRYNKNFFKGEGYLTFSIPASAEEHIFAKRLAAILCQLIMSVAIILSLVILVLMIGAIPEAWDVLGVVFTAIGDLYALEPVHATLFTLEALVFLVISVCVGPCIFGAASCFMSKQTERKKMGATIVLVFIAAFVAQSALSALTQTVVFPLLLDSEVGIHIAIWLYILANAAATVLCVLYEIKFLKKKLDLK